MYVCDLKSPPPGRLCTTKQRVSLIWPETGETDERDEKDERASGIPLNHWHGGVMVPEEGLVFAFFLGNIQFMDSWVMDPSFFYPRANLEIKANNPLTV